MTYTLALIQAEFKFGNLETNLKKAEQRIREAASHGASLVVLPESFNRGYSGEQMQKMVNWSEPLDGPTITAMAQLAQELNIFLVPPLLVRMQDGVCENTAVLLSDEGKIIGTYAKSHLCPGNEMKLLRAGGKYPVFDTKYGKIGFIICNDLNYPEAAHLLGLQGAEVIINPAAWRYFKEWDSWFHLYTRTRAIENQAVFASVNQVGVSDGRMFSGESTIASPLGVVLGAAAFPQEEIVYSTIALDHIRTCKQMHETLFKDRRPADYRPLYDEMHL